MAKTPAPVEVTGVNHIAGKDESASKTSRVKDLAPRHDGKAEIGSVKPPTLAAASLQSNLRMKTPKQRLLRMQTVLDG